MSHFPEFRTSRETEASLPLGSTPPLKESDIPVDRMKAMVADIAKQVFDIVNKNQSNGKSKKDVHEVISEYYQRIHDIIMKIISNIAGHSR